jgi:hypothetical protein
MLETAEQIKKRFEKCESILESIRGRVVSKCQAKEIYQLSKGNPYKICEYRLDDNATLVVMQIKSEFKLGDETVFIVRGQVGKNLNMQD